MAKLSEIAAIFSTAKKELEKESKGRKKNGKPADAPAKAEKKLPSKVYANIVTKKIDGEDCFFIKNMKDLPKDIKKGLRAYHKLPVDSTTKKNLKKAMKALGVTSTKNEDAVVMPERKQAPPKFEPRTYSVGGNDLVELGYNHKPRPGDMYLVITESKKGKKKVKDIMVTYLMYSGNHVVYLLIPKTEDALIGVPEMLKKREVWSIDLDTKERITSGKDAMSGLLIPVKNVKEDKKKDEDDEAVNE